MKRIDDTRFDGMEMKFKVRLYYVSLILGCFILWHLGHWMISPKTYLRLVNHPTLLFECSFIIIFFSLFPLLMKHQQRELSSTKQLLESFIQDTPDAINILDTKGNLIRVNKAFETALGYSADEIKGEHFTRFVPPHLHMEMCDQFLSVLEGHFVNGYETQRITKDGRLIDVSVTISAVFDASGNAVQVACASRDISNRRQVEAALRESEEKLRLITDHVTDMVCTVTEQGKVEYISPSSKMILNYEAADLIGLNAFNFIHPDDVTVIKLKFQRMLKHQEKSLLEFRLIKANGQFITVEATAVPVVNKKHGGPVVIIVARDITERKETEEILRRTEKLSVVGQLAAGVAHEIRNPLTSLKGFVQLMKSRTTEHHDYYEIMLTELERINYIVSEFMVIAKPKVVQFEHKDITDILLNVISLLGSQAIMNNVQIETQLLTKSFLIDCDENQLKQVFINVLKNGIEAMPDGGEITVTVQDIDRHHIQISFKDQGCGIPAEVIDNIGLPFFTTKEKGTGLGLMVCNKIIENHNGEFRIESEIHKGTTIHILLPKKRRL